MYFEMGWIVDRCYSTNFEIQRILPLYDRWFMYFLIIKILLTLGGGVVAIMMGRDLYKHWSHLPEKINPAVNFGMGFIADFCDALGVGSYAVTIALNRIGKQIPDQLLPGTLAVGVGALPTVIESYVSMTIIPIEPLTLFLTSIAAAIGGWIGAKVISGFSEDKVRLVLGGILIAVGIMQLYKMLTHPEAVLEGTIGVTGIFLIIGCIGEFIIGMLQAWGLGFFAPTLALFLLLGMNTKSIYPIMMSGAAAGIALSSVEFINTGQYAKKASLFLAIGGILGCVTALFIVKSMDLKLMNWIVSFILLYVGSEMFIKGWRTIQKGHKKNVL